MQKRAQHIAEYMIVFEVFAVATVVLITALGLLPDIGWGTMVRSSDELLSVGKIGLLAHEIDECGGFALRFRNNDQGPITLEQVYIGDEPVFLGQKTFLAGASHYVQGSTSYRGKPGELYVLPLRVAYRQDTLGSGLVTSSFSDPLYGHYATFTQMGEHAALHQGIVFDYCFLGSAGAVANHAGGASRLQLFDTAHSSLPSGHKVLTFDESYARVPLSVEGLSSFTLEALVRVNHTKEERGVFYKPNTFFLTVKGDQLRFGVFASGKAMVVTAPIAEDTWSVVHMVMDDELKLYVDGSLKQSIPFSSMDASSYPLYVGTFTPESGKNSVMSLGSFQFSSRAMIPQEIVSRSAHLRALTME